MKPEQEEKIDYAIVSAIKCGAGAYLLVAACGISCLVLLEMYGAINPGGKHFTALVVPVSIGCGVIAALTGFWWRYHQS